MSGAAWPPEGWRVHNPDWPSGEGPHLIREDSAAELPDRDYDWDFDDRGPAGVCPGCQSCWDEIEPCEDCGHCPDCCQCAISLDGEFCPFQMEG